MPLLTACQAPEASWEPRSYYDIYDEAVNLYYKPPRRPEAALTLMERACRRNSDGQDILCYNLGILRELEGQPPDEILAAYHRAHRIRPHLIYLSAIRRHAPDHEAYGSPYLRSSHRMIELCRAGRSEDALSELRHLVKKTSRSGGTESVGVPTKPSNAGSALPRNAFSQPYFADCLGKYPEYAQLLEQMRPGRGDLEQQVNRARAANHPFRSLWDVELNLRGLENGRSSDNPATAEWQDFLEASRQGQGAKAALHLRAFFDALDDQAASATAESTTRKRLAFRVQAFKRAAAVLIEGDSYFHRIRNYRDVKALIQPLLRQDLISKR